VRAAWLLFPPLADDFGSGEDGCGFFICDDEVAVVESGDLVGESVEVTFP